MVTLFTALVSLLDVSSIVSQAFQSPVGRRRDRGIVDPERHLSMLPSALVYEIVR
jgi:hypothetical protein